MASQPPSTKQDIIASLFSKRAVEDGNLEESYISHVKIFEDDGEGGGVKARYLTLSAARSGRCFVHKAKRNSNGTFSKGKTWNLEDLRVLEVVDAAHFNLIFSRAYKYTTDRPQEQAVFLEAIVKIYKRYMKGKLPQLIGFEPKDAGLLENNSDSRILPAAGSSSLPAPTHPSQAERRPSHTSVASAGSASSQLQPNRLGQPRPSFSAQSNTSAYSEGRQTPEVSTQPLPIRRKSSRSSLQAEGRETASRDDVSIPTTVISSPPRASMSKPRPPNSPSRSPGHKSAVLRPSPVTREVIPEIPEVRATSPHSTLQPSLVPAGASAGTSRTVSPSPSFKPVASSRSGPAPPPSSLRPPNLKGASLSPSLRRSVMMPMAVQTSFSRDLLLSDDPLTPLTSQVEDGDDRGEGEEDVILANVEEMLDGWNWNAAVGFSGLQAVVEGSAGSEGLFGIGGSSAAGKGKGKDWEMEKRLADELNALQGANIYSLLETDERVAQVIDSIDDVISQLDTMDAKISSYKIQLNAVSDDISYIESQNRGLQVQTSNQKALLGELENLLTIVQVENEDLMTLTQESPGSDKGIVALEGAASSLYKALQATRETAVGDMHAAMERLDEYLSYNSQFCKRIFDYLTIKFKFQAEEILTEKSRTGPPGGIPSMQGHDKMEADLMKYSGLIMYMKEMDEARYQKLAATYFGISSDLHRKEMKALLLAYIGRLKDAKEDATELFVTGGSGPNLTPAPKGAVAIARSKTVSAFRSPLDGVKKDKKADSEMKVNEIFERAFTPVINGVYKEEALIAEFLQINNQDSTTFADYMGLEPYVRRQASRFASRGDSQAVQQLMRSSMDLIFGFLAMELKAWIEGALQRDNMGIVGIMAASERFLVDAEQRNMAFVVNLFQKQLQRLNAQLEQFIGSVIRAIESTKLTIKKRKGVAPFVKHFPVFIDRFESQLIGTDGLQIRTIVDGSYERIATTIFDSLQQMAKLDGADGLAPEDKGQLNYHVILIENMHFFIGGIATQSESTFSGLMARAQGIYRDNLASYMRLVLRKPLSRLMDFFETIERTLHSGAASPAEIPNQPQMSKAALKKVLREHDSKDIRKAIEAIYKRIDKHFDLSAGSDGPPASSSALVEVVAEEVESELLALREKWTGLVGRCYADPGLMLEFTSNDITTAFKRAKSGV